jgi:hypothetical protein
MRSTPAVVNAMLLAAGRYTPEDTSFENVIDGVETDPLATLTVVVVTEAGLNELAKREPNRAVVPETSAPKTVVPKMFVAWAVAPERSAVAITFDAVTSPANVAPGTMKALAQMSPTTLRINFRPETSVVSGLQVRTELPLPSC